MILSTTKKASKLSFCYKLKTYVLMVSTLAFVIKTIRLFSFSAVKKVNFPWSKNFSAVKKLFHSQGTFPKSEKFPAVKKIFHRHGTFPQSWKKFSTVMKVFHKQEIFQQKKVLPWPRNFPRNKYFYTVKTIFFEER